MTVAFSIANGRGDHCLAEIDAAGAVSVVNRPLPPFGGGQKMRVMREFLTADGTSSGSKDMRVDGSVTNQDFWIQAHEERDRYICILSFVISDQNAVLNQFGNLSALTNGCRLFYTDILGEVDIHDSIKSNFQFMRLSLGRPSIGATADAFRANNVSGTNEGYIPYVDIRQMFGFEWGVRLAVGSRQRLTFRIRDDLSVGMDQFDCVAYGFERFPD